MQVAWPHGGDDSNRDLEETRPLSWLQTRLQNLFCSIHEELDCYTKTAWAAFWSPLTMNEDTLHGNSHVIPAL